MGSNQRNITKLIFRLEKQTIQQCQFKPGETLRIFEAIFEMSHSPSLAALLAVHPDFLQWQSPATSSSFFAALTAHLCHLNRSSNSYPLPHQLHHLRRQRQYFSFGGFNPNLFFKVLWFLQNSWEPPISQTNLFSLSMGQPADLGMCRSA